MDKRIIGFLVIVILTSSVYVMIPESVRIDIQPTKSIFKVWENDKWEIAGVEQVRLFDGRTRMNANQRDIINYTYGDFIIYKRDSSYKENITMNETYVFLSTSNNVELFPVEHEIITNNAQGKILQYDVTKLVYTGKTIKGIESPQSFGRNMKVEWGAGNYYSKIYKYFYKDEGKLTIKYRINSDYEIYNVRLFDPAEFIVTLNSPVDNYNTTDTTPDFNFTVNGTETSYSCELFLNDTGYGTDINFLSNMSINTGESVYNSYDAGTYMFIKDTSHLNAYYSNGTYITQTSNSHAMSSKTFLVDNGTYIYTTKYQDYNYNLIAYTFDGSTFTEVGNITNGTTYRDMYDNGTYIFVGSNLGLIAYTFNGTDFTYINKINTNVYNVWGNGSYIYAITSASGLYAYTFNGSTFTEVGHIDDTTSSGKGLWFDGTYIYTASGDDGLGAYTFDGSTFANVGVYNTGIDWYGTVDVCGYEDFIYITNNNDVYDDELIALTYNGTDFQIVGYETVYPTNPISLWANSTKVYLSNAAEGLRVYNFGNFEVPNNTAVTIITNSTLSDGTYEWNITCNYTATSNTSETRDIIIDTTAPTNMIFVSPTKTNNSYVSQDYYYVNITFTELYPDICILESNGVNYTMLRDENNCYINQTSQSENTYTYYIWINDTVNNLGKSNTQVITLDITPPNITIYSPDNSSYYDIEEIDLNVSADEVIDTWWYELNSNGTNVTFIPNTTIINIDGQNNITVWLNDTSGNINSTIVYFFIGNTTITVNYTSGDYLEFDATSYDGTFPVTGQNDTTAGINITNLGNVILDINITVNTTHEPCFTFWFSNDSTLNTTLDYNVTDTMQNIITSLAINDSIDFWVWMIFDECTAGTYFWYMDYYDPFES